MKIMFILIILSSMFYYSKCYISKFKRYSPFNVNKKIVKLNNLSDDEIASG